MSVTLCKPSDVCFTLLDIGIAVVARLGPAWIATEPWSGDVRITHSCGGYAIVEARECEATGVWVLAVDFTQHNLDADEELSVDCGEDVTLTEAATKVAGAIRFLAPPCL